MDVDEKLGSAMGPDIAPRFPRDAMLPAAVVLFAFFFFKLLFDGDDVG